MYGSVNPELLGLARAKLEQHVKMAFIPGNDPNMQGGGDPSQGGAPPGGDPSQGGGAPPGMDPSQGGAPPGAAMDPTAGQGGATPDLGNMIQQQVQAAMQAQGGGAGAGAGGGAGGIKPKIDQNVVMLQILKILAKIADALKIPIPASEMVVTPEDLRAMAQGGPGGRRDSGISDGVAALSGR